MNSHAALVWLATLALKEFFVWIHTSRVVACLIIKYLELNTSVWVTLKTLELSKHKATEQITHFTENVRT